MDLAGAYLPLRQLHLILVAASLALFFARGIGVLLRQSWPSTRGPRVGSVAIDTLLLATGATLWFLLGLNPTVQTWLGTKLALLLLYIVLGSIALKRGRTPAIRGAAFVAALLTVAAMVGIARAHHPLGWFLR
jgi:uncharacterized membrane protein SirB2